MLKTILLSAALALAGCSTLQDFIFPEPLDKDAKIEWRKDMKMKVNGKEYFGMVLLPRAQKYNVKIYPFDKRIDRLQWKTCAGGDSVDKAVKYNRWKFWNKGDEFYEMEIAPTPLELERACPMEFVGLSEKHKNMSFGMLVFPYIQPWISLPATLECNRQIKQRAGTGECQAPVGSINRITFQGKVYQDDRPNEACPPMSEVREGVFEFFMPKDLCVYEFRSLKKHEPSGKWLTHKLLTYGFEKIPPPEGV